MTPQDSTQRSTSDAFDFFGSKANVNKQANRMQEAQ